MRRLVGNAVLSVFPIAQVQEEVIEDIVEVIRQLVLVGYVFLFQLQIHPVVKQVIHCFVGLLAPIKDDANEISHIQFRQVFHTLFQIIMQIYEKTLYFCRPFREGMFYSTLIHYY